MSVVLKEFVFLRVQQFFRVNVEGLVAVFGIFLMTLGFRVALKICLRAGGGGGMGSRCSSLPKPYSYSAGHHTRSCFGFERFEASPRIPKPQVFFV